MSYDNTNRGQMWRNDKKEKDSHPDFKGSINIEGVEYWLNGWSRRPDANPKAPAVAFSVQKKETANQAYQSAPQQPQAAPTAMDDFDSYIPF